MCVHLWFWPAKWIGWSCLGLRHPLVRACIYDSRDKWMPILPRPSSPRMCVDPWIDQKNKCWFSWSSSPTRMYVDLGFDRPNECWILFGLCRALARTWVMTEVLIDSWALACSPLSSPVREYVHLMILASPGSADHFLILVSNHSRMYVFFRERCPVYAGRLKSYIFIISRR